MVTTTPKEPTIEAPDAPHYESGMPMAAGSELRLNLKALGVDRSAPDFGERLCELSRDNEPYDLQLSAHGKLIVVAPSGSDSNIGETVINAVVAMWQWMEAGSRSGWLPDPIDKRAYIYRAGQDAEFLENPAVLDGEDVLPGFVLEVGQLMFGQQSPSP